MIAEASGTAFSIPGNRASVRIVSQTVQSPARIATWASVRPTLDRPAARKRQTGKERGAADEQVAVPGEAEAALDQELPAVGGGNLAGVALELDAVEPRIGSRVSLGRCGGLGQRGAGRAGWNRSRIRLAAPGTAAAPSRSGIAYSFDCGIP